MQADERGICFLLSQVPVFDAFISYKMLPWIDDDWPRPIRRSWPRPIRRSWSRSIRRSWSRSIRRSWSRPIRRSWSWPIRRSWSRSWPRSIRRSRTWRTLRATWTIINHVAALPFVSDQIRNRKACVLPTTIMYDYRDIM